MLKGLILGLSATTNMILIGVGGALAGAAVLKTAQVVRSGPRVQPVQPVGPQMQAR